MDLSSFTPLEGRVLTATPSFHPDEIYWVRALDGGKVCPAVCELTRHLIISGWIIDRQNNVEWLRPYLGAMTRSADGRSQERRQELFDLAVNQSLLPWVEASQTTCQQLDSALGPADWAQIATGTLSVVPHHYQWLAAPTGLPVLAKAVFYQQVAPISDLERAILIEEITVASRSQVIALHHRWLSEI